MAPTSAEMLVRLLKNNHHMVHELVDGITQEQSMLQPPYEGNCLNWVVGHLLDTYNTCLGWLGAPVQDTEFYHKTYGYGSAPVTDPAKACRLEDMLKRLDAGLLALTAQLECAPPVELESPIQLWLGTVTKIEALHFMFWHITYHTGQLEQLRQLRTIA